MNRRSAGDEAGDGAEEELAVVDAVGEHVAQFAGGGQLLDLPPAEVAVAPVLEAVGAEVVGRCRGCRGAKRWAM